jgi:hypothetical protein
MLTELLGKHVPGTGAYSEGMRHFYLLRKRGRGRTL